MEDNMEKQHRDACGEIWASRKVPLKKNHFNGVEGRKVGANHQECTEECVPLWSEWECKDHNLYNPAKRCESYRPDKSEVTEGSFLCTPCLLAGEAQFEKKENLNVE